MDLKKIEKLIDIVIEKGIAELEIHEDEKSWVRINNQRIPVNLAATNNTITQPSAISAGKEPPQDQEKTEHHSISAPMVGTVYLSASPGAQYFVDLGQPIKAGDTLCLIEAMKTFNRIEADKGGVIKKRLVENGQPVEYGQPLFLIEEK